MTRSETFEDFYALLEVPPTSSVEEIRQAFRARMREWHPDVNPSPSATAHTQRLIVAYKILNDAEARRRYDVEYARHSSTRSDSAPPQQKSTEPTPASPDSARQAYEDPELDRWVRNAKRQAADEWSKFTRDFADASKAAGAGALQGLWMGLLWIVAAFIVFSIIAALN